ncbi:MAG: PDZ domain-containing protein [Phycisphaerales bacterium]
MARCRWGAFVAELVILFALVFSGPVSAARSLDESAAVEPALPESWVEQLEWRSIGPANMSGRITDLAVYEEDPSLWWAATASGGLLKTVNNGTTFEHQFDQESTVSIGAVAVAPTNPEIVWVGTGESNPRNSVSWGDGVYKSTDGGATWEHKGLKDSYQIGEILIHPDDPDTVFVAALGRLWGPNEERGLYKTIDGGANWTKILHIDEKTGVGDVDMDPNNPEILLAAAYERQRDGFDTNDPAKKWGPGGAIYRSTDGGQSWLRVTEGLPTSHLGRVNIEYARSEPDTVYALVECAQIGMEPEDAAYAGLSGEDADFGARLTEVAEGGPAEAAGLEPGDIVYAVDDTTVHSFGDLQTEIRRRLAGDTVTVEASRERETITLELTFTRRPEPDADEEEEESEAGGDEAEAESEESEEEAAEAEVEAPATEPTDEPEVEIAPEPTVPPVAEDQQPVEPAPAEPVDEAEAAGEEEAVEPAPEPTEESESESEEAEEEEERPRPFGTRLGGQRENLQDQQGPHGYEYGGLYKSTDGGLTWTRINSVNPRPMYFSRVAVDPSDDQHLYVLGISLYRSKDGGETFTPDGHGPEVHVDHHALWINPNDGRHMILGNDGGIYVTHDRMETWEHLNRVAIGQFYHITVSPDRDYRVYGGLQDNGSWGGPNMSRINGGPINEDWIRIGGGDGFICRVDREDPNQIYFESQNGFMGRYNFETGERGFIRPRPERGQEYRFNWRTPFILSNHNSRIYYTAGNHVFRSLDKGESLRAISPEITNTDRGSATALAESRFDPDVLYVGTDDGALWMTENGGHDWVNLFDLSTEPEDDEQTDEPVVENGDADASRPRGPRGSGPRGEGPARGGGRGMAQMIERLDANDDGKLQRSEAPDRMAPMFDRMDANKDGVLTEEELSSGRPGQPARTPQAAATNPDDPITGEWDAEMLNVEFPETDILFNFKLEEDGQITGRIEAPNTGGDVKDGRFDAESGEVEFGYDSEGIDVQFTGRLEGEMLKGSATAAGGRFTFDWEARRKGGVTTDRGDGHTWKTIDELMPEPMWVSSLEASKHEEDRIYLTIDGHRSDDDRPHVFVSEDRGRTWRSLVEQLPATAGSARVLREDLENPDLLYLGAEFGAWVSIDRGATWTKFNGNFPTVAVHEIAQHPTSGEIIAGTHGRSAWVLDVTPLRQMTDSTLERDLYLFEPNDMIRWRSEPSRGVTGARRFVGENPSEQVEIYYYLGRDARDAEIEITDVAGESMRTLQVDTEAGFHRVTWDARRERDDRDRGGRRFGRAPMVPAGSYEVTLRVGNETMSQRFEIHVDPKYPQMSVTEETDAVIDFFDSFGEEESDGEGEEGGVRL